MTAGGMGGGCGGAGVQLFLAQKHMLGKEATHQEMMWRSRKVSRVLPSVEPGRSD